MNEVTAGKLGEILKRSFELRECENADCVEQMSVPVNSDRVLCFRCKPSEVVGLRDIVDDTVNDHDALVELNAGGVNCHRYKHATLESFRGDEDPDALIAAQSFVSDFIATRADSFPTRGWLFFYGTGAAVDPKSRMTLRVGKMGNGKTHLAIAIARELIQMRALRDRDFRFVTAEELLLTIEATYRNDSGDSVASLLRRFSEYKLVIIDDFGVRKPTDHVERIFDELCKRREGQATIWTSNLGPKQLAELGLSRILSRFTGNATSVAFNGHDRRSER